MAYFSNSTDAEVFQANWCARCRNWRDRSEEGYPGEGAGCPVIDAHWLLNHEMHKGDPPAPTLVYTAMALLIADAEPAGERRCHLFVQAPYGSHDVADLYEEEQRDAHD